MIGDDRELSNQLKYARIHTMYYYYGMAHAHGKMVVIGCDVIPNSNPVECSFAFCFCRPTTLKYDREALPDLC